jgi:hypothetical protein
MSCPEAGMLKVCGALVCITILWITVVTLRDGSVSRAKSGSEHGSNPGLYPTAAYRTPDALSSAKKAQSTWVAPHLSAPGSDSGLKWCL